MYMLNLHLSKFYQKKKKQTNKKKTQVTMYKWL